MNCVRASRSFLTLFHYWSLVIIIVAMLVIIPTISPAQEYARGNKKYYKAYYKKQNHKYTRACDLLERKRNQKQRKPLLAHRKPKPRSMAEVQPSDAVASVTPTKPQGSPTHQPIARQAITPKVENISPEKLTQLHKNEDEVLSKNDLPVPTSQQHERMRKIVADKLASKTNVYPLNLAPLYFNFDQDEFSVVDMEPFLIAAEYAMQGRTVLIEGHTDSRGQDDYNVKLSIKRVQKIRQLMLDMGVPDDRISVVGYGEEIKSNNNTTEQGRQLNRRVDFTIF